MICTCKKIWACNKHVQKCDMLRYLGKCFCMVPDHPVAETEEHYLSFASRGDADESTLRGNRKRNHPDEQRLRRRVRV